MEPTEAVGVIERLRSWESRQARLGGLATESAKYGVVTCESTVMGVFQQYRRDAAFLLEGVASVVRGAGSVDLANAWSRATYWVKRSDWLDLHNDFMQWTGQAVLSKDAVKDLSGMRRAVQWFCTDLALHLRGTPEAENVGQGLEQVVVEKRHGDDVPTGPEVGL